MLYWFSAYSFRQFIPYVSFCMSTFFTLRADRSHSIGLVVAQVRLGRLAVVYNSFVGHFLADTTTSVRE
jgi:hypothetical protein